MFCNPSMLRPEYAWVGMYMCVGLTGRVVKRGYPLDPFGFKGRVTWWVRGGCWGQVRGRKGTDDERGVKRRTIPICCGLNKGLMGAGGGNAAQI